MRRIGIKFLYIVIAVVVVVLYLSGSTLRNIFSLKNEASLYEDKLSGLKKDNEGISRELCWIESEKDYVKYVARKKLGFVDPDEIKFYIVENGDSVESKQ